MALREEFKTQGDHLFKYRSYFPLILLVLGLLVFVMGKTKPFSSFIGQYQEWMEDPAIFISLFGLAIRLHAVGFSGKNTSGRNTGYGQLADILNTRGLYSLTRNPLYLGNYLMWLGIAMLTGNPWFVAVFTLVFWIYYERIIFAEEEYLRTKFADQYLQWAARTPIFIPTHLRWRRSESPFLWRKVLKQEKNSLVPLFLIFSVFDVLGARIEHSETLISKPWLLIMFGVSATAYIMIKLLKRRF